MAAPPLDHMTEKDPAMQVMAQDGPCTILHTGNVLDECGIDGTQRWTSWFRGRLSAARRAAGILLVEETAKKKGATTGSGDYYWYHTWVQ